MIVSFAIGNSDDRLGQADWSAFVCDVLDMVDQAEAEGAVVHFGGCSGPAQPWQNAVWVLELGPDTQPNAAALRGALRAQLAELCGKYGQDSIAWWEAHQAEMIPPAVVPR